MLLARIFQLAEEDLCNIALVILPLSMRCMMAWVVLKGDTQEKNILFRKVLICQNFATFNNPKIDYTK